MLTATVHLFLLSLPDIPAPLKVFFNERFSYDDETIRLPSLSSLSKYWIDPSPTIQQAARSIFNLAIDRLPASLLKGFIDYWLQYCMVLVLLVCGNSICSAWVYREK